MEKENSELRESVCCCEEQDTKENPIEIKDSKTGLPYMSDDEDEVLPMVPAKVLPAMSSQHCLPHVSFASCHLYPSISLADGAIHTVLSI